MADDKRPRPVSGEIMTDEPKGVRERLADPDSQDIVDAEFESVTDVAASAPAIGTQSAPLAGMDMLRGDRDRKARGSVHGGPVFWALGIGLAAAAFWVSGGHAVVRGTPFLQAKSPPQLLRISGVSSRVDVSGAHPVLFVDGEAANDGSGEEALPALDIVVTGNDGRITRYRLGTASRLMAPGETFAFSSRLDVPNNGVKTVSVTFGD